MRVYISGAITGTNDYRERFARAEDHLKRMGHTPVNPVKISDVITEMLPDATHDDYMAIDLTLLNRCDAIYMLHGWENSKGAVIEHDMAVTWRKEVFE